MIFDPPLVAATLIRRYKRFLFDAVLEDGREIAGFCANTGSMRGLTTPGSRIYLSQHDSPNRKYRYAFEMIEAEGTLVGVNTALPNRLAQEAIRLGLVSDLLHYEKIRTEQRYGENSRIDLLLSAPDRVDCYVEIKNVHFVRQTGLAEFPDSVTTRGAKHLNEMAKLVASGTRAVMLYVIQRPDCEALAISADLDPAYGRAFTAAVAQGVEAYAVKCSVTPEGIAPVRGVPVRLTV
ncbi:DNA/RNA nuclease SfsA [Allorhizobium taibaishanense]|uniref:Sugar fermentation stimulation protein homolog n=1 Tax=Allorhizobium taibaishanense TaxID=887144 RepID=A0A1Q9A2Y6_9HYPH|nr:DNA/RNA nuclease SfsA [Allorhizobium taibaishanense]MBB4005859.1 sugar fermentation stimulation protein A [Allorhizobium taibaishanense]OLP48902.1 sugar fermentation stimulation protein SfsA [Allorhizobium taibaishanense]